MPLCQCGCENAAVEQRCRRSWVDGDEARVFAHRRRRLSRGVTRTLPAARNAWALSGVSRVRISQELADNITPCVIRGTNPQTPPLKILHFRTRNYYRAARNSRYNGIGKRPDCESGGDQAGPRINSIPSYTEDEGTIFFKSMLHVSHVAISFYHNYIGWECHFFSNVWFCVRQVTIFKKS